MSWLDRIGSGFAEGLAWALMLWIVTHWLGVSIIIERAQ